MIKVDKIKEIRQLRFIQGLTIREISRRTGTSRNTVRKVLRSGDTKFTYIRKTSGPSVTDKIESYLRLWLLEDADLKKKKRRTSKRMYDILRFEYGYQGSYRSIARAVNDLKVKLKQVKKEAFVPLHYPTGEAFQFDWSDVEVNLAGVRTELNLAVMQLCHSRFFFARLYPSQKQELMLDAHRRGFEFLGGICRRGIYDNMTTAVKKILWGRHRNLQEKFMLFTSHYLFEPEFCNPAHGNEKGRVEKLIAFIKMNFFVPMPYGTELDEFNERLLSFCIATAHEKKHPEQMELSRYEVYEQEKRNLIDLPVYPFECCRTQYSIISPYSTAAFDNNRYSVPTEYVGESVLVKGYSDEVSIVVEGREVARHKRMYGKGEHSFDPYHYLSVLAKKPGALRDGLPFKNWDLPGVFQEYRILLKEKFDDNDRHFARILMLLNEYPLKKVTQVINEAVKMELVGENYIIALLRKENDPVEESNTINIRSYLSKYRAEQQPCSYYDEVLREEKSHE